MNTTTQNNKTVTSTPLDDILATHIDPWLRHMTWRHDFATWRKRRMYQEDYQQERLLLLGQILPSRDAHDALDGIRLLDVGAGMGGFAVAAARAGAHVVACEYHRAYCDIIRLRGMRHHLRVPVCNVAGEQLPFANNSFALVTCWDVIEHVQSPTALLAELARVVQPGGYVVITVINRRAWIDPHYHMRGINWLPRRFAEWLICWRGRSKEGAAFRDMQRLRDMHYYRYHEFVALATRYGFVVTDLREVLLQRGQFTSSKRIRRMIRILLRLVGLERIAYRMQRNWYTGMFELALHKPITASQVNE